MRQYQSAKTMTLVSHNKAPENRSCTGDSLCEGKAWTNSTTELTSATVMIELMAKPRMRFRESRPIR